MSNMKGAREMPNIVQPDTSHRPCDNTHRSAKGRFFIVALARMSAAITAMADNRWTVPIAKI
ncbi:MAG: hypothetical protein QHH07_06220 [Sedimentisphaerales bacterium]|nr:hypothetical protein [Sedimentisphaerales bacterium]